MNPQESQIQLLGLRSPWPSERAASVSAMADRLGRRGAEPASPRPRAGRIRDPARAAEHATARSRCCSCSATPRRASWPACGCSRAARVDDADGDGEDGAPRRRRCASSKEEVGDRARGPGRAGPVLALDHAARSSRSATTRGSSWPWRRRTRPRARRRRDRRRRLVHAADALDATRAASCCSSSRRSSTSRRCSPFATAEEALAAPRAQVEPMMPTRRWARATGAASCCPGSPDDDPRRQGISER